MLAQLARTLFFAVILALFSSSSYSSAKPVVEVGFVLDTTGSMGPLIEGAKRKIWSIATSIVDTNPDAEIRMGLVAYRDIGDEYVTKMFPLTTDIQDLYANLLELRARGGGDWPESVNEALHVGVTKLTWTQGDEVRRIMFLVGDAPPHMDYAQDVKYPEVMKIARERDIIVNAVQAGGARDTERVWREIAQMGRGRYIPIPQDGGQVVIIETPYDIEILELQGRINGTVIPYGPRHQRSGVRKKTEQYAAAPRSVASEMAGYMSEAQRRPRLGEAVTGAGDLVADVVGRPAEARRGEGRGPARRVQADEPGAAPGRDRQADGGAQVAQRAHVGAGEEARRYVTEQRKKAPKTADSFDRVVEETLKAQIRR